MFNIQREGIMTVDIQLCLNEIDFVNNLGAVNVVLQNGESRIIGWGRQVVQIPNYSGTAPLDKIIDRICAAAEQRCRQGDLTTEERIMGKRIVEKLEYYCCATEAVVSKYGLLMKIILRIRRLLHLSYFKADICKNTSPFSRARLHFRTFTEKQLQEFKQEYQEAFSESFNEEKESTRIERKNKSIFYSVSEDAINKLYLRQNRFFTRRD